MSVPTVLWSETTPAGSDNINAGDNRIRELKTQIREVIDVDHDFPSSGQAADNGQHKKVTLQEQADLGTGAVSATILGSQTVSGKGELVYTDEDDNDVPITSGGKLSVASLTTVASISTIMNLIYPVGYVITLGVSTNPGTLLGIGTWTAIEGRVIVGKAASGTFDTLDEELGAETVTLTGAQSGVAAHTHTVALSDSDGALRQEGLGRTSTGAGTQTTSAATPANAAEAHSNLQPSITKYVWQRTA